MSGGKQEIGLEMWQFRDVDLAAVARAMGCHGERVTHPDQIGPALQRAMSCGRAAVVDVATDIKVLGPAPWAPPPRTL